MRRGGHARQGFESQQPAFSVSCEQECVRAQGRRAGGNARIFAVADFFGGAQRIKDGPRSVRGVASHQRGEQTAIKPARKRSKRRRLFPRRLSFPRGGAELPSALLSSSPATPARGVWPKQFVRLQHGHLRLHVRERGGGGGGRG